MRQRAREKALDILEHHLPEPLPQDIQEKIDQIVAQAISHAQ
jgi:trimethylamine:corrinoid methyltransferase-like protein